MKDKSFRVWIAGGGTGGHLYPGLALAQALKENSKAEVLFIGTKRGLEVREVPKAGFALLLLSVLPLRGRGFLGSLVGLLAIPWALFQAFRALWRQPPAVVVSVGGYAAGPAVLAAALCRIPCVLVEQNSVAGLTQRLLAPFARFIFLGMPCKNLPAHKSLLVGNPVRQDVQQLYSISQTSYPEVFSNAQPLNILVMGGSQGAKTINDVILRSLESFMTLPVQLFHQAGDRHIEAMTAGYLAFYEKYAEQKEVLAKRFSVVPFIEKMAQAYEQCHLVICRAGASTLAELALAKKSSVLIPYPYAADDHQTVNAKHRLDGGACWLLSEKELSTQRLLSFIHLALDDPQKIEHMSKCAETFAKPDVLPKMLQMLSVFKK